MSHLKSVVKKELDVVIHGQSARFRIIKWIIILAILAVLVQWKGWSFAGWTVLVFALLGIVVHFLFRWKTGGWSKSWWLYKKDRSK